MGREQDSRAERAKKNLYPHFSKCGGTSKQISVGAYIEYIEICCLVVALINIGRPRPIILWIRERDSLVMARLDSWLNLAAICHTLYSARSDVGPLTFSWRRSRKVTRGQRYLASMLVLSDMDSKLTAAWVCWHVDLNNAAVQWGGPWKHDPSRPFRYH